MHTIDWVIVVVFMLLIISIGLSYGKKAGKNISSFFLGGRDLPWYIAGISMVATTFAADTPLAVAELVGNQGISGNWVWWNFLIGGMLTTFFFARLWRRSGVLTEVELIELRYSGKPAAFLRGFKAIYLGVFLNILIIGWVSFAMISIVEVFFGVEYQTAMLYVGGLMLFTAIYSAISGLLGVAMTDVIQFIVALGGCIVLAVIVVNTDQVGGIEGMKAKLDADTLRFLPKFSADNAGGMISLAFAAFLARIGMQWWASWYPGAEPGGGGYVAQRMMSAKDEKHSVYATLFFQIAHYGLRPWPWIIVGLCALILYPAADAEGLRYGFVYAMKDYLPVGLKGLLFVAFVAAYMSTISTQLNWGASYVLNDFYKRFFAKEASDKKLVNASRLITLMLMVLGLGITYFFDSISGVWDFMIECGAGLGLVLILRWFWWRVNAWAELTATIVSIVAFAIAKFAFLLEFPISFFFIIGVTTVSWIVVMYLTPPTEQAHLQRFYDKVRPYGNWWRFSGGLKQNRELANLVVCWLSATVLVYACLFGFGKLILAMWAQSAIFLGVGLIALLVLRHFVKQTKIFAD